ncbi:hypothetical protein HAX54_017264 [Datura stramonium]|uniref:HORMA domain-containing protein n=1 Tax=Datura stramonium TaxID=4076 RepID=A0ABS8UNB1_DATST|nr:hypothetical protein [Datura stramonium]
MKIKKLMPMDAESRRLIDWMEKEEISENASVLCVWQLRPMIEEYAFSFSYSSSDSEEVSMNVNRVGMKKGGTFKSNSTTETTPNQMSVEREVCFRSSACKMVRTLIQLMRTLDKVPEERTILMKLLYHDDVTVYALFNFVVIVISSSLIMSLFFRGCTNEEALNPWMKNPLKLEVGNVNSKHFAVNLKAKSVLDPCNDENDDNQDDVMSLGADSAERNDSASDSEFSDSDEDQYIVAPVEKQNVQDKGDMVDEDDTQDPAEDEQQFGHILEKLSKEGMLSSAGTDTYIIKKQKNFDYEFDVVKEETEDQQNQNGNQSQYGKGEDYMYMKALFHALPMTYVTVAKLQHKLEGEAINCGEETN